MDTSYLNEKSFCNSLVLNMLTFTFNNTAWHLLLHKQINVLHSLTEILSHFLYKLVHSSLTFFRFFSSAFSFINFQTFLIGFMSRFWTGYSITVTSSSERNVLADFTVWHGALSYINTDGWLISAFKLGMTYFLNISVYSSVNFTVKLHKGSCTINWNQAKHYQISSSKFNTAFSALRWIPFFRTVLNKCSTITTKQVKLWLIAEMNTISPFYMLCGKFLLAHFVLFRNVRFCRSYLAVQIYFI